MVARGEAHTRVVCADVRPVAGSVARCRVRTAPGTHRRSDYRARLAPRDLRDALGRMISTKVDVACLRRSRKIKAAQRALPKANGQRAVRIRRLRTKCSRRAQGSQPSDDGPARPRIRRHHNRGSVDPLHDSFRRRHGQEATIRRPFARSGGGSCRLGRWSLANTASARWLASPLWRDGRCRDRMKCFATIRMRKPQFSTFSLLRVPGRCRRAGSLVHNAASPWNPDPPPEPPRGLMAVVHGVAVRALRTDPSVRHVYCERSRRSDG